MKAKFGSLVVSGSGKIGGQYMQSGQSGSTLRTSPVVTRHATARQLVQRTAAQRASRAWSRLTDAQRDSWHALAPRIPRPGKDKSPYANGFAAFMSLCQQRATRQNVLFTDPPTDLRIARTVLFGYSIVVFLFPTLRIAATPQGSITFSRRLYYSDWVPVGTSNRAVTLSRFVDVSWTPSISSFQVTASQVFPLPWPSGQGFWARIELVNTNNYIISRSNLLFIEAP